MKSENPEAYLYQLHKEIMLASKHYELPWHLLSKVNEEYMGYLTNSEGNYYYQWLALIVKLVKPNLIVELGNSYGLSK